jgi:hypothetical protein
MQVSDEKHFHGGSRACRNIREPSMKISPPRSSASAFLRQFPRLSRSLACCKLCAMPNDATFESFEKELNRLVESFGKRIAELKSSDYNEAKLRDDFLNPFFRALGCSSRTSRKPSSSAMNDWLASSAN